jgi:hypothetical protein
MESKTFTFRQVGTTGCEIVGPDGVIAWTVDSAWAVLVVALLNGAGEISLTTASSEPTRT